MLVNAIGGDLAGTVASLKMQLVERATLQSSTANSRAL